MWQSLQISLGTLHGISHSALRKEMLQEQCYRPVISLCRASRYENLRRAWTTWCHNVNLFHKAEGEGYSTCLVCGRLWIASYHVENDRNQAAIIHCMWKYAFGIMKYDLCLSLKTQL